MFRLVLLFTDKNGQQAFIDIGALFRCDARCPSLLEKLCSFLVFSLFRKEFSKANPFLPSRIGTAHGFARCDDRSLHIAATREKGGHIIEPTLFELTAGGLSHERAEHLIHRFQISPASVMRSEFKDDLRFFRLTLCPRGEDGLHDFIKRFGLGKSEHWLVHLGIANSCGEKFLQALDGICRFTLAQVRLAPEQDHGGHVFSVALNFFINELRCLTRSFVIQQSTNKQPAILVRGGCDAVELAQPMEVLIHIHRDAVKRHQVRVSAFAWRFLAGLDQEFILQIIESSKALMKTHPLLEKIAVATISKVEHSECLKDRCIGLLKLVGVAVNAGQVVESFQFLLWSRLLSQTLKKGGGPIRESGL